MNWNGILVIICVVLAVLFVLHVTGILTLGQT
jgi:hypothetical protein